MRIVMISGIAGTDAEGFPYAVEPGEATDRFSEAECARLIAAGAAMACTEAEPEIAARPVPGPAPTAVAERETAVAGVPETRKPRGRARKLIDRPTCTGSPDN